MATKTSSFWLNEQKAFVLESVLVCAFLFFVRLMNAQTTIFFDYDSTQNWAVACELSAGSGKNFFNHASPFFHALNAALTHLLGTKVAVLVYFNAGLNVLGLWLWANVFRKVLCWTVRQSWLFCLLFGLTFFQLYASFCVAVEHLMVIFGALLFVFLLKKEKRRQANLPDELPFNDKYTWLSGLCMSLAFNAGYRFLIVGFALCVWMTWQTLRKLYSLHYLLVTLFIWALCGILAFLFWSFVGFCWGAKWYGYAANLYGLFVLRQAVSASFLDLDWLFFFYYSLDFEPFLWVGLLLFYLLGNAKLWPVLWHYCLWAFLLVALLTPKAPRALVMAFPFLYALLWQVGSVLLQKLFKKDKLLGYSLSTFLVLGFVFLSWFLFEQRLLRYLNVSAYQQVAEYLQAQQAKTLKTTFSINILPLLEDHEGIQVCTNDSIWQQTACNFALDDAYCHLLKKKFSLLRNHKQSMILEYPCPHLLSPILFLEHCEYTNETYSMAWKRQQELEQKGAFLYLYDLRP